MEEIIRLFMTLLIFSAVIRAEKEASYSVNQDKEQHKTGEILIPNRKEVDCLLHILLDLMKMDWLFSCASLDDLKLFLGNHKMFI